MKREYDIAIVGAGMTGATLAALLADSGMRILLADAVAPERFDPSTVALRVSALAPASARVLDAAGAWKAVLEERAGPYRAMTVWDADGDGEVHFDAADAGMDVLGWIAENSLVQQSLLQRLERAEAVDFVCPLELTGVDFGEAGVVLRSGSRRIRVNLLVGADGAGSKVRQLAGIGAHVRGYGQRAVVAVVRTRETHHETAWQRFLPGGPVALLPLSDGRCSTVWSLPDDQADEVIAMDEPAFCAALGEATGFRLGEIGDTGPRAAFPLSRLHAHDYVRPRCALIGDAAHVVHPLAGQGANLGLLDAAALSEALLEGGMSWRALRRYARWRRAHNLLIQESLDGLHHLFRARQPALVTLRGMGFNAVDRLPPLKRVLAKLAAGQAGDLPACARPNRPASTPWPRR